MTATAFNQLDYVEGAINSGFTRNQAEYGARELSKMINNELVTKSFLANELANLELKIIIKVGGMMVIQTGIILSMVGFMFKHV